MTPKGRGTDRNQCNCVELTTYIEDVNQFTVEGVKNLNFLSRPRRAARVVSAAYLLMLLSVGGDMEEGRGEGTPSVDRRLNELRFHPTAIS